MAASATLHCLTGCAIGEILGLVIGTAVGLGGGSDSRPVAAYPVNLHLLRRGKGHALTHGRHASDGSDGAVTGARRLIPVLLTLVLAAASAAFMLGGVVVSLADQQGGLPRRCTRPSRP